MKRASKPERMAPKRQKYTGAISLTVRLQKQLSRRFRGKEYAKWVVVLPPRIVRELGWKEGQELMFQIDGKTLRMKRLSRSSQ
jgi:hypothetical protein